MIKISAIPSSEPVINVTHFEKTCRNIFVLGVIGVTSRSVCYAAPIIGNRPHTASASVVDQCHYNVDPDPDPTSHFDVDPDTYPSHVLKMLGNKKKFPAAPVYGL